MKMSHHQSPASKTSSALAITALLTTLGGYALINPADAADDGSRFIEILGENMTCSLVVPEKGERIFDLDGTAGCDHDKRKPWAIQLHNVPSATRFYLSSERKCGSVSVPEAFYFGFITTKNPTNWVQSADRNAYMVIDEFRKYIASPAYVPFRTIEVFDGGFDTITDASDENNFYGKLGCVKIIAPTPAPSTTAK